MKIEISTIFDCQRTGVTGRWREGQDHINEVAWNLDRNRQRNFETLLQTIGMRTQLVEVSEPVVENQRWTFTVVPDRTDVFDQELRTLRDDCDGVPMLVGLGELGASTPQLTTSGPEQNIWFRIIESE